MAGLGSLGALAGGFSQGMNDAESNALKKLQLQAAKDSLAGEATAGNIMSEVYGGPTQQPAQPITTTRPSKTLMIRPMPKQNPNDPTHAQAKP